MVYDHPKLDNAFKPTDWGNDGKGIIRIQNLTDENKPFNKTVIEIDKKYLITAGDILVSWSATIDVFEWKIEDAWLNQHIFKVEPNYEIVDKGYFKYAVKLAIAEMLKYTHGSTMKHVNRGDFLGTQIPLPPLPEQKRIAAILDKANSLRRKRQQAMQLADDFLRAVFLDMFGDPVTNPKGWEKVSLGSITKDIRYGSSEKSIDDNQNGALPILRIPNIYNGKINIYDNLKYVTLKEADIKKLTLEKGDLLFVRSNGNPENIGRCAVYEEEKVYIFASYLIRVRLKENITLTPSFVQYCLSIPSFRARIVSEATTTAGNYNINTQKLNALEVVVPDERLVAKFDNIQLKLNKLISKLQFSFNLSSEQFNSLSQKAFAGEL